MREITSHVVDGDKQAHQLKITATDDPGAGGANHRYQIDGVDWARNPSGVGPDRNAPALIIFQNGGIPDNGVNGLTNEALLAIVADRLECFQAGPFAAQENATALSSINNALRALQQWTIKRIARGVEGTQTA